MERKHVLGDSEIHVSTGSVNECITGQCAYMPISDPFVGGNRTPVQLCASERTASASAYLNSAKLTAIKR